MVQTLFFSWSIQCIEMHIYYKLLDKCCVKLCGIVNKLTSLILKNSVTGSCSRIKPILNMFLSILTDNE